jgi:hypothetical protein
VEHLQS